MREPKICNIIFVKFGFISDLKGYEDVQLQYTQLQALENGNYWNCHTIKCH